jgi:NAD(P)-dependent dehydrogenase (short-subunit alcohol dehydrogenase family)
LVSPNRRLLEGKVAVVTGAGRGIGRTIAARLAAEGANLALIARTDAELKSAQREFKAHGVGVLINRGDVSNDKDVKRFIDETLGQYGRIDVLVNNAGVLGPIGPLEDNDINLWLYAMKVNLFGVFLACRYVLPSMKERRQGKIINISGAGAPAPYARFSAYSSSKTGVLGLTQTLAEETREFNIQVNAVAPGISDTRMQDEILSAGPLAGTAYHKAKEVKEKGGVDLSHMADLVVYLASDESDGITGKLLSAKWDDWKSFKDEPLRSKIINTNIYTIRRIDGVFFGELERKGTQ